MEIHTCGEAADYFATQPRDRLIVMASDAEGNNHSPLADAEVVMYAADSTWSGEVYPTPEDLAALIDMNRGWSEEDAAPDDAVRVVVLGPTN